MKLGRERREEERERESVRGEELHDSLASVSWPPAVPHACTPMAGGCRQEVPSACCCAEVHPRQVLYCTVPYRTVSLPAFLALALLT